MKVVRSAAAHLEELVRVRIRVLLWRAVCILACLLTSGAFVPSVQAVDVPAKRVLLISTGSRFGPGFIMVDRQIISALESITSAPIEVYAENLDIVLFPAERTRRLYTDYLTEKYADRPPDLIVLVYVGNVSTPVKALAHVFPGTPLLVAGLTEEELATDQFGSGVSGFAQRTNPHAALDLMLRLQPDLARIVVVSGTAASDRQLLERVKQAAGFFDKRVTIEYWDKLSMSELRRGVADLPARSAVLFTRFFRDAAGQQFISAEVGMRLGEWSNAPVYVLSDASIGTGVVGGAVASVEAFGRKAGELARLILTGTPVQSLPFEIRTETVPIFDWRALERWGIDEARLPPQSVIRHRPQSVWSRYHDYIATALLIIAVQSAFILVLIRQIRQRRRAQAAHEESRSLMELATDAGELGLWSRDVRTGAVWTNARLRTLFGLQPQQEMTFEDAFARVHPDDRQRVVAEIERADRAEEPFQIEYRVRLPDGAERWMLAQGRAVPDPHGTHARRMGVVFDITQRKRIEESLDHQRAFLRQVIDVNPNFIFAKDRAGRFTLANQAVADAYGVSVDALIGKTDADFNPNREEVEFFRRMDLEVMDTLHERFIPEERITNAQGRVRFLQTVKRPIIEAHGKANQLVGASTDITQRKLAEFALQEQRAELAHVERVSIMGELVASLMHELNQPLTAILSNAQAGLNYMAHEPLDVQELREVLTDIVADDKRAAEIIRGMRALAKKETNVNFERLDMGVIVCDVVKLLHGDAALRGVSVEVDLDHIAPVWGHRIQLQQVLINLLLNAFDAVAQCPPAERRLQVRAGRFDDRTNVVSVSDCGPGLGEGALGRIFERFYSTKREGLGLGLAICRSIIVAHGGSLWAQNNPGRGATFSFTVPLVQSTAAANLATAEQRH